MRKKLVFTPIVALVIISVACHRPSSRSTSPSNSASPTAKQLAQIDDLRKLAETQCGTQAGKIDVNASLLTVGCDDLDVVELIMTIEQKYNVTIPDSETDGATINSLARIINKR